jgi:hypothetical protein
MRIGHKEDLGKMDYKGNALFILDIWIPPHLILFCYLPFAACCLPPLAEIRRLTPLSQIHRSGPVMLASWTLACPRFSARSRVRLSASA